MSWSKNLARNAEQFASKDCGKMLCFLVASGFTFSVPFLLALIANQSARQARDGEQPAI